MILNWYSFIELVFLVVSENLEIEGFVLNAENSKSSDKLQRLVCFKTFIHLLWYLVRYTQIISVSMKWKFVKLLFFCHFTCV